MASKYRPRRTKGNVSAEAAFWKVLTKTAPANEISLSQVDLSPLGQRHVQLFEVLVTETLAKSCPDLHWRATQVVADEGVDLLGEGQVINCRINTTQFKMAYVVVGQVKRSQAFSRERAAGIIDRILDWLKKESSISHLLIIISGEASTAQQYRQRLITKAQQYLPGIPTTVLDAKDFVSCWQADPDGVLLSISRALSPTNLAVVADYLSTKRVAGSSGWRVSVEAPTGVRVRGALIDLPVRIMAPVYFPGHQVGIAWRPGRSVDVVRPLSALASEVGPGRVRMVLDEDGSVLLSLRFRATVQGAIHIGQLELVEGAGWRPGLGHPPPSFSLGTVEIEEGFDLRHVYYVGAPHEMAAAGVESAALRARAGSLEVAALIGPGGIGKTRLVDELIDRMQGSPDETAEDRSRGLRLSLALRVDHDTERSRSRRFLLDVVLAIARPQKISDSILIEDPAEIIRSWLRRFSPELSEYTNSAIELLTSGIHSGSPIPTACLIAACIIARTRHSPIFLHLSNLHWADNFEIAVLSDLVHRLRQTSQSLLHGILIILEGRTDEMADPFEGTKTTDAWQELCASQNVDCVRLNAWNRTDSEIFLNNVLRTVGASPETDQTLKSRHHGTLRKLREHILSVSAGNPMHIIEYVRLLLETKVLVSDSVGKLVLMRAPEKPEIAARSLVKLVLARVEYARRKPENVELIALLKILAEIGLSVNRQLFDAIVEALSDSRVVWRTEELQVAQLPGRGVHEFRFIHETYRLAFRRLPGKGTMLANLRRAALAKLGPPSKLRPDQTITWSRLMRLDDDSNSESVREMLYSALDRSRTTFDFDAMIGLAEELLTFPEHTLNAGKYPVERLKKLLSDGLAGAGDWALSRRILDELAASMHGIGTDFNSDLFFAEIAVDRGNIFGDQLQCDNGIRVVQEGLQLLRPWLGVIQDERLFKCRELLLNRLGVLHWFSGEPDKGARWQLRALQSARRHDPDGERQILFSCEVGTLLLHRYPSRGRSLLKRACLLLEQQRENLSPTLDYVEVQHEMSRLLDASRLEPPENIERACLVLAKGKTRPASIYGACLAWLTAGAAAFLNGNFFDAEDHFQEALWLATQSGTLRVRWKIHLGIATALRLRGNIATARVHARHASSILLSSLETIGGEARSKWSSIIRLPLEHVRRILGTTSEPLDSCLYRIDQGVATPWVNNWASRPGSTSKSGEPFQILHVRRGDDDVFLMG